MEQQVEVEKKRWWIAGVFSFLIPGLGQLYNSEAAKGILFYCLTFMASSILFLFLGHTLENPDSLTQSISIFLILMLCAWLLLSLLAILDAIRSGLKGRNGRKLKPYNRWSIYVSILVVYCGFSYLIPYLMPNKPGPFDAIETYKIPSGSMLPTVEIGDHLICNLMYYRSHNPQRGDIIIFQNPSDENKDYIKRIVGLPGDTVELRQNTLFVNGQAVDEPYAVYLNNGPRPRNYGRYFISENEYFVMGDNRNNSRDSRFYGTVKRESIRGKASFIYFSWDMGIPVWNIPGRLASIRFERIGKIL